MKVNVVSGIGMGACVFAILCVVGGKVYCLVAHPEWTDAMALRELWWLWLLAIANLLLGMGFTYWGQEAEDWYG